MRALARTAAVLLAVIAAAPGAAQATDLDRDGLEDRAEDELLRRFAPVLLLHPTEPALPGNAEWLLARAEIEPAPGRPYRVLAASLLGVLASGRPPPDPTARLHLRGGARAGSADPGDWVAYGHAVPAQGGGVLLQYWFLYPFNDAYGLFDHEGDWEHVTVKLGADLRPEGAWYARHHDVAEAFFPWDALAREGDHPVVLAARGTHASYASRADAPFWERVCPGGHPAAAAAAGCPTWRTWESVGIVNLGERGAPRAPFLSWPGRWGATGRLGLDSRRDPPPGPAFQRGWCSRAAPDACR